MELLDAAKERLEHTEMLESNRVIVGKYLDELKLSGVKDTTLTNNIESLVFICRSVNKRFEDLDESDLVAFFDTLDRYTYTSKRADKAPKKLADSTKDYHKLTLKRILKLIRKYELADKVKIKSHFGNKLPEDILTDDDVNKMINAARNMRDASLIAVLYESGCRRGEIASCKISNLTFDAKGAKLKVSGKTGDRVVPLVFSVPYLRKWLDIHPKKMERTASLWTLLHDRGEGRCTPMTPAAIAEVVKSLGKDAGITKPVSAHKMRHARATRLAGHFSEPQMRRFLGWSSRSSMASIYTHLSNQDIEDATLEMYGLKNDDKQNITVRKCPNCSKIVSASATYCDVCNTSLEV